MEGRTTFNRSVRAAGRSPHAAAKALWVGWNSPTVSLTVGVLTLVGVVLLPLEGAATIELVYTIRPSYVVLAAACLIGLPLVIKGWRLLPGWLTGIAVALIVAYMAAALIGSPETITGQTRAGDQRVVAYLLDLILGLSVVGVMVGVWTTVNGVKLLMTSFVVGAVLASLYGIYQWPAFHFGWPLADVTNALNTDGVTRGSSSGGVGLLGWERVSSTFREPRILGSYLAIGLPLAAGVLATKRSATRAPVAVLAVLAVAMLLTLSAPSWATLLIATMLASTVFAAGRGWTGLAALAATLLVIVCIAGPVLLSAPRSISALTGRDSNDLVISARERTDAWSAAVTAWERRPLLGFGPGQSAVQLTGVSETTPVVDSSAQQPLGTAHGLWASALVDGGLVGLFLWAGLLTGALTLGAAALLKRTSVLLAGALAAATSGILSAQVEGDRLDLWVWVAVGVLLALVVSGGMPQGRRHPSSPSGKKRLLLVSHGPIAGGGGGSARWRSFSGYLGDHGWELDVVSGSSARSSDPIGRSVMLGRDGGLRARVMSLLRKLTFPIWKAAGMRALPLSTLWLLRGASKVSMRVREQTYDVVLATGPQMVALSAARIGLGASQVPFVVEFRDLWAGNPAYDRGGRLLGAAENWVLQRADAVVVTTPEAAAELRARYRRLPIPVHEIPNGFEPVLLNKRRRSGHGGGPITIIHSGSLIPQRPLAPLLSVLAEEPFRSSFRLVLHGYLSPESQREVANSSFDAIEVVPPSPWEDAIKRIEAAEVTLVLQAADAGDETAVAAKVYEYLAIGKPVLCVTDGGATEQLLRRLGAASFCARLDEPSSITRAARALMTEQGASVSAERLRPYARNHLAHQLAAVLDTYSQGRASEATATAKLVPDPREADC